MFGAFGLTFWYGTQRYLAGAINSAGPIVVVLLSVMMVITSAQNLSVPLLDISKAMVAACELFTVIDTPQQSTGSFKPDSLSEDLLFNNVTFEYPGRPGVTVLDNLSFCIRPGQNTAIVGSSGSGKSTIVGLIERWYCLRDQYRIPGVIKTTPAENPEDQSASPSEEEPKPLLKAALSGSITIGGFSLEDLDLKWWRSQIGLVQQEPFLFNDTIFNNVANGLIGTVWEDATEEQKRKLVREACQEAYAHEFVARLPDVSVQLVIFSLGIPLRYRRPCLTRSPRDTILESATAGRSYLGAKSSDSPSPEHYQKASYYYPRRSDQLDRFQEREDSSGCS